MKWRCNSCGGEYADHQADGSPYYHVCPPDRVTGTGKQAQRVPIANPRDERSPLRKGAGRTPLPDDADITGGRR